MFLAYKTQFGDFYIQIYVYVYFYIVIQVIIDAGKVFKMSATSFKSLWACDHRAEDSMEKRLPSSSLGYWRGSHSSRLSHGVGAS